MRHADSEGNEVKRLLKIGNRNPLPKGFGDRHSSDYHLTNKGYEQAKIAGEWIRKNGGLEFDLYYTSPFLRATETADSLQLPFAQWDPKPHLRERDWGVLDTVAKQEEFAKYEEEVARHRYGPFVCKPAGAESMADLCVRASLFCVETLQTEGDGKNVIAVAHGDIMRAFQIVLGQMSVFEYLEMAAANRPEENIYNCQIFHYSREGPARKKLCPNLDWMRSIRPTDPKILKPLWMPIKRQKYTNSELRKIAGETERMIK